MDEDAAVGGQAVLNGVMMRGPAGWAVAVRSPGGGIAVHAEALPDAPRWARLPLVRGLAGLVGSVRLGMRALAWSASIAAGHEVRLGRAGAAASGLALTVFTLLPLLAADRLTTGRLAFGLADAVLGTALLAAYVALVGRVPEVRAFFEYHGAEHKAVAAHEAGAPATAEAAVPFSTRHARCGTTFLLVVAVLAAAANALIGRPPLPLLVASRLLVVPVVAAVAYELLRLGARHQHRLWVRRLLAPGLALQGLTTREPSLAQLEVAVAALSAALAVRPSDAPTGLLLSPGAEQETRRETAFLRS